VQRKRLGYILIGGGLVMALSVGVMVYSQVSEAEHVKASLPTARVVIATGDILQQNGFTLPAFVAPSDTNTYTAWNDFDTMWNDPNSLRHAKLRIEEHRRRVRAKGRRERELDVSHLGGRNLLRVFRVDNHLQRITLVHRGNAKNATVVGNSAQAVDLANRELTLRCRLCCHFLAVFLVHRTIDRPSR